MPQAYIVDWTDELLWLHIKQSRRHRSQSSHELSE